MSYSFMGRFYADMSFIAKSAQKAILNSLLIFYTLRSSMIEKKALSFFMSSSGFSVVLNISLKKLLTES